MTPNIIYALAFTVMNENYLLSCVQTWLDTSVWCPLPRAKYTVGAWGISVELNALDLWLEKSFILAKYDITESEWGNRQGTQSREKLERS